MHRCAMDGHLPSSGLSRDPGKWAGSQIGTLAIKRSSFLCARTSLILKYELLLKGRCHESRLECKRSVDEPMMGIPDRPESWPASRFFAFGGCCEWDSYRINSVVDPEGRKWAWEIAGPPLKLVVLV